MAASALAAPCSLDRLPLDCLLRVLQSRCDGCAVLSPRDLAALLVAAPLCAPAVAHAAGARIAALLGSAAGFNAPQSAAQLALRLALAERVDGDLRAAGFAAPATATAVRTTIVCKASGRVASYGDAARERSQAIPRERIKACSNKDNLSLVVCEPAVVYIFGWFSGHFVWHERTYESLPQSPSLPKVTPAADAAVVPPAAAAPAPPPAVVPVAAAAPPPLPAEESLSLEERVAIHLRRVRYYIAHRNAALLAQ